MRYTRILVALALALSLTSPGQAQTNDNKDKKVKPAVDQSDIHRMVIYNGSKRTVHYVSKSNSPAEQAALRNLERAENEAADAEALLELRRQYVATESALEARRRQVQMQLYGRSYETRNSASMGGTTTTFGPQSVDAPLLTTGFGFPFGGGFGYGGFGNPTYGQQPINTETFRLKTDSRVSQSLAHGIGDEGQFKREMVAQMARHASPEHAAAAYQAYTTALASFKGDPNRIGEAGHTFKYEPAKPRQVIVKLKDKEEIKGELVHEDSEWIVIRTEDSEVRVRTGEVARMRLELPK